MHKVGKFIPPNRDVIKDITLSFFRGQRSACSARTAPASRHCSNHGRHRHRLHRRGKLGEGYTVGMLEQEPELDPTKTVLENVMDGAGDAAAMLAEYDKVLAAWSDPDADRETRCQQADLEAKIEAAGAWDLQRTVEIAMDALRTPPGDWGVENLSGGEVRRVAMARLLLAKPDLLSSTSHQPSRRRVGRLAGAHAPGLRRHRRCSDPRSVLPRQRGGLDPRARPRPRLPLRRQLLGLPRAEEARIAQEKRDDDKRNRTLKRELEWVRMAPKARQSKARPAWPPTTSCSRNPRPPKDAEELSIVIPANKRLGDVVIEASNISKAFGDKLLIDDFSFTLPPAGIVGVIGANGAGKSTLFKMLIDEYEDTNDPVAAPDSGTIRLGSTVQLGYVDQNDARSREDGVRRNHRRCRPSRGRRPGDARPLVRGVVQLQGPDQQKLVSNLSGGERNRVHLAKVLKEGANVLLLDEPTNDLDIDTLRALEDAIEAYAGCAVIVSHDRWFLDRVATHIVAFEGESQVRWFEGNFTDYAEYRKREHGVDAMRPHRIKYKPVTRG